MKKFLHKLVIIVLLGLCAALLMTPGAQATTHQEILNQYVADLQKNPNDNVLREKIIKHVQAMKPAPAIPEEARKYMVRGKTAFKGAKETKDFNDAADEFQMAILAAPWLAEGYYNLGIVQDKAGQYTAAIDNLKLYVIAAPDASDVEKVKELIYEIEYRQEKAAREAPKKAAQAAAERKQKENDEFIKSLDGAVYTTPQTACLEGGAKIEIYGKDIYFYFWDDGAWFNSQKLTFDGQDIIAVMAHNLYTGQWSSVSPSDSRNKYFLSKNGDTITHPTGATCGDMVFRRIK
jgi:tetratricopeptide (TPR) repeat protein